ncbi:matrixin family metalloprotease [Actinotalea sp. C106]|uniref:matrixin family metalloprotease n=1 Tax=Actinotalea sp. C106 TaxID=2908644 RepID=UPI002028BDD1|nr:matrixin family metalloprotease [Actinotalea sp. C106]
MTAALCLAVPTAVAQADEGSPFSYIGQDTPKIAVYPYSYNSQWQPGMDAALANWNATYSPVSLTKKSSSTSTVTAASYSANWYGYYQACGGTCLYIRLNSRTISKDSANQKNYVTSVLVHEYGHALNLGHRDGQSSIMNRQRNRNTMVKPSSSDVTNVIRAFPSWNPS